MGRLIPAGTGLTAYQHLKMVIPEEELEGEELEAVGNRLTGLFRYALFDLLAAIDLWLIGGILAAAAISTIVPSRAVKIPQQAKLHAIKNNVELWAAYQMSSEHLYQISSSKCQVSLIYLGPDHATINYPCALVHLTVGYVINSINTIDGRIDINLLPNKLLITYSDGIQEFKVEGEDLIPSTPFRPFKKPAPYLTRNK